MIRVHNLTKRFGHLTAVDNLTFEVKEGEIFSLLGPNGAGKTTTISILATLLLPTSGEAWIDGYSILQRPLEVRRLIGVVPQEIALYQDLSGYENLWFWGQMYGLRGAELRQRIRMTLEQVGLDEKAHHKVRTYSGGMKRRLNLAAGLLHHPRVLFLDEPTVGIDPQSRRAILDFVKSLNREGMTILYTTHYMEEAQELSHRVGIMDHGRLIALGTQSALLQQAGEHDTLVLSFENDLKPQPPLEVLRHLSEVINVSREGDRIKVLTTAPEEVLPHLVTVCLEHGVRIRSVEVIEPNLETVFLKLTGRALRD
ncbi:ATP-binding cassette domain-containing protein [uncultured Thermanaerothrix sp.]|uniref:ABC transporter ATP-binding protein n=1 Tax=uncultured Thermanaerothrix sp. TaxID=1195149 RepID=UPI002636261B|nr:ATP-binding cassette domain-containing protein [uncultured Thermanaerothrix sp.]